MERGFWTPKFFEQEAGWAAYSVANMVYSLGKSMDGSESRLKSLENGGSHREQILVI